MADYDSDDDEYVILFDLLDRFAGWCDVLTVIREHETVKRFKLFATKKLSPLTPDKIDKALNPDYFPWRNFHTDLVQSVADAKGKSKSGAARGSVMHMNRKCSLKEKLCESHIEEFDTIDRKGAWRSVLQSFACLCRGTRKQCR
jgi:hypothetical protein